MSINTQINRITSEVSTQSQKMAAILQALQGKSGGGGVTPVSLTVTENGTYTAPSGQAYTPVTVNVPVPSGTLSITENGTYNVSQYASATVNTPVPSGTISITENGNYNVSQYASATVNVQSGGGSVIAYNSTVAKITNKTSFTSMGVSVTVPETGNYKCSWIHFATAAGSYTYNYSTQLYANGVAKGSSHYCPVYNGSTFAVTESSIALTAGQTLEIRGRTRSGSTYWTTAGMLVIEKI